MAELDDFDTEKGEVLHDQVPLTPISTYTFPPTEALSRDRVFACPSRALFLLRLSRLALLRLAAARTRPPDFLWPGRGDPVQLRLLPRL